MTVVLAALSVPAICLPAMQPPSTYHVVHGWPRLPDGLSLGIVSGVGVDSHDRVYVFRRGDRIWPSSDRMDLTPIPYPTVLVFEGKTGKLVAQWGNNAFAMPHGLTVDARDNIWLTDVARHQVYKYSQDGRLLMTLGERGIPGDDNSHFNRPTKVAVAGDGSFHVSDGYVNSRVIQFSADGKFLRKWGSKGSKPGQFNLPHGIALDHEGHVYVADRSNRRVQVFTGEGAFLREWKGDQIGRPFDVAVGPGGMIYVADGGDVDDPGPLRSGVAVVRQDGAIIDRFGRFGHNEGEFTMAHDLAVGRDGAVYVGDAGHGIQKFVCGR